MIVGMMRDVGLSENRGPDASGKEVGVRGHDAMVAFIAKTSQIRQRAVVTPLVEQRIRECV
jgi:hypothetical protein